MSQSHLLWEEGVCVDVWIPLPAGGEEGTTSQLDKAAGSKILLPSSGLGLQEELVCFAQSKIISFERQLRRPTYTPVSPY